MIFSEANKNEKKIFREIPMKFHQSVQTFQKKASRNFNRVDLSSFEVSRLSSVQTSGLQESVRVLSLPPPEVAAHVVESELGLPIQLLLGQSGVAVNRRYIPRSGNSDLKFLDFLENNF